MFQNFKDKTSVEDKRYSVVLLNEVLDQILTGKYYYKSKKMFDKKSEEDLKAGKTSKYIQGLDFKTLLKDQTKQ